MGRMLAAGGEPPVSRRIGRRAAYFAGGVLESIYHLFRIKAEPPITRWVAAELSSAHWFDISAARRDLGYDPVVTMDEGMRRLADWLRETGEEQSA